MNNPRGTNEVKKSEATPLVQSTANTVTPEPQKKKLYPDIEFTWKDVSYSVIDPKNKKVMRSLLSGFFTLHCNHLFARNEWNC